MKLSDDREKQTNKQTNQHISLSSTYFHFRALRTLPDPTGPGTPLAGLLPPCPGPRSPFQPLRAPVMLKPGPASATGAAEPGPPAGLCLNSVLTSPHEGVCTTNPRFLDPSYLPAPCKCF